MRLKPRPTSSPDYLLIAVVVLLTVFGMVMLASASSDTARLRFGNSYYYLNHQLLHGLIGGVLGFVFGMFFYYRRWEKLSLLLLIATVILLFLVFSPVGFSAKGASRWISIGGFSVQPAELLKISFLIYLAAWLAKSKARSVTFFSGFVPFMILVGLVILLIVFQPSTTAAAILFFTALITYFMAGARFSFLVIAVLVAFLGLALLVLITPYRLQRITTFINPESDELGQGYHINQSLIAIGSGGIFGVGYGNSAAKLNYLPEPIGDSIFAVIAEELGFVGSSFLIILFLFLVIRGLRIARAAPDAFGKILVTGFITLIGIQAFINIGAVSGLIPFTGVPLPFISFGGTALAVFLTMSGIIVNVSRYR